MIGIIAILAPVIPGLLALGFTTYFAWHQRELTRQKLRLDLFDRRVAVYISALDFYQSIQSWNATPEQVSTKAHFFSAQQSCEFLFADNAGVGQIMAELAELGVKVVGFKENAIPIQHSDPKLFMQMNDEVGRILIAGFPEGLKRLKAAMLKFVAFPDP